MNRGLLFCQKVQERAIDDIFHIETLFSSYDWLFFLRSIFRKICNARLKSVGRKRH
jgi:hypothetical protein